ncbi:MAG: hypothetical protein IPJ41_08560 [Phycisphaerales bacterium]|nr:hypothetical protein [Phycisphaerales bacterium]
MSWIVFAIGAWLMLGLEQGLKGSLQFGPREVVPSFVAVYAVFLACSAPARAAQWGCLLLGVMMDLSSPMARPDAQPITLLGPNALGALLMCQLVLALRGLMFRRNPLSIAFLSLIGFATWQILATALLTIRSLLLHDPAAWSPAGQLAARLGSSLYTGVVAIPLSLLLILALPAFGFQHVPHRFAQRR